MDAEYLGYVEAAQFDGATDTLPAEPVPDDAVQAAAPAAPKAAARVLEYAPGRHIALAPYATYALIENPDVARVPGAARYAYGLVTWQDKRLPLIDLNILLHPDSAAASSAAPRYALVVAYRNQARGPLAYGAVGLSALPQTVFASDEDQCALPADSTLWPQLALSCFRHEGQAVPILDAAGLFATRRD